METNHYRLVLLPHPAQFKHLVYILLRDNALFQEVAIVTHTLGMLAPHKRTNRNMVLALRVYREDRLEDVNLEKKFEQQFDLMTTGSGC